MEFKNFTNNFYGYKFVLVSDYKPHLTLPGPKKGILSLAAERLQRWTLLSSAYSYDIEFRPTEEPSTESKYDDCYGETGGTE